MRYLSLTPEQQRADYRQRVEKAVHEHPEDAIAQLHYLKLSLEEGQADEAAGAARAIVNLKASAAIMTDSGRALLEARQYSMARELLEKAATADPSAGLELDIATAIFRTSGAEDGLRQLDRVPATRRGAGYHSARAQMLDAAGKIDEAIVAAKRAMQASPKDPSLYWQASVLLYRDGRPVEADDLLRNAGEAMRQEPQFAVMSAAILELSGVTDDAMAQLDRAQRRWPEFPGTWAARGMIQAAHKRYPEATQALTTAVSLGARSPEVLGHLADCILRAQPARIEEAEASIDRALRLAPDDPWLKSLSAQIRKQDVKPIDTPDPRRLFQSRPPAEW